ncbi:hypothetical protein CROQUDRAFT_654186 [Cronartium quercuum f. sp. fusiforme G11]|uniref:Cryptic loci regulator 2 N-terminal domain-containing protein n=1 Tax=Cronartium quercuum f. sp. fusiforme G11 TaxID=708437 RepID=A0A9P6TE38_9BASI|nr:hypothetical protein CROQUDRAFT_654186 [Cronartium quercuum f. sp. fusiforme G11]
MENVNLKPLPDSILRTYYSIEKPRRGSNAPHMIICLSTDVAAFLPLKRTGGKASIWLPEEDPTVESWFYGLGRKLAKLLGLNPEYDWKLKSFPKNYRLYCYWDKRNAGSKGPVLYGPARAPNGFAKRGFESMSSFLPHLFWLCSTSATKETSCVCCMCSSNRRGEISHAFKNLLLKDLGQSRGDSTTRYFEVMELFHNLLNPKVKIVPMNSSKNINNMLLDSSEQNSSSSESSSANETIKSSSPVNIVIRRRAASAPSLYYTFSRNSLVLEDRDEIDSPYRDMHLINFDLIPSRLPQYRKLELVWYRLPRPILIPEKNLIHQTTFEIRYWPAIVVSRGSKLNKSPLPFFIRLLGIKQKDRLVDYSDLRPWRGYDYNKLRKKLEVEEDMNITEPSKRLLYSDPHMAMANLAYAIQIGIHLDLCVSCESNLVDQIDLPSHDNSPDQIWLGAEVVALGDFVILNSSHLDKYARTLRKKDEKVCEVMLITKIQERRVSNQIPLLRRIYNLSGHLYTLLIRKSNNSSSHNSFKPSFETFSQSNIASQPYAATLAQLGVSECGSRSGYTFYLITESRKEGNCISDQIIGRMYSLNHLGKSYKQEKIQKSDLVNLCGLNTEQLVRSHYAITSRSTAISHVSSHARKEVSASGSSNEGMIADTCIL